MKKHHDEMIGQHEVNFKIKGRKRVFSTPHVVVKNSVVDSPEYYITQQLRKKRKKKKRKNVFDISSRR